MDEFIYNAINKIRKRPGMYLGRNSIVALDNFIGGYCMALFDLQAPVSESLLPLHFGLLHYYVANHYGVGKTAKGWRTLILEACGNNESSALDKFWGIYDAFCELKIVAGHHCVFSEKAIEYHHNNPVAHRLLDGNTQPIFYKNPIEAYVFELSTAAGYICIVHSESCFELKRNIYPKKEDWYSALNNTFGQLNWAAAELNESLLSAIKINKNCLY